MASNKDDRGGCRYVLEKLASSRYAAAMLLGGFVLSASVMALHLGYGPPLQPLFSGFRLPGRRRKRPIRVYMDGCFDMMHYGHCNALRQARALGDELVVGVVSDEEITENKGPPVTPINERLIMVGAIKWVDEVIPDAPYAINEEFMYKLFNEYNIDYIIHGDDPCLLPDGTDAYALAKKAGRYKQIKRTEGVSSTDIVGGWKIPAYLGYLGAAMEVRQPQPPGEICSLRLGSWECWKRGSQGAINAAVNFGGFQRQNQGA